MLTELIRRFFKEENSDRQQEQEVILEDTDIPETILLDFPACIERDFPQEFPLAWEACEQILTATKGADFSPLERHSPGLKGFDWESYIRLSVIRMVRVLANLSEQGVSKGRLLDLGAYFGNFSLMCSKAGYQVDALDGYGAYGEALKSVTQLLSTSDVQVLDFDEVGYELQELEPETYDVVLCMGVIEHIPHTPRLLLASLNQVLKPGGLLVLDTPNLAYLYNRQKLARGESIFPPISLQYFTEIPFEGHHREYTRSEIEWLLNTIGHQDIRCSLFNYSIYGLSVLQGTDLDNYKTMLAMPDNRELILTVSRKSA
ncbi:MAG: class I SAM-dependent methyltransferase [Symploca sp. SIO2C1]|nr:class I SAM-dependent methyltransferase [Symploca sp. SIO2C1]